MKKILVFLFAFLSGLALAVDLPVRYFQYVESTGEQYVDTGFKPSGGTKIEVVYQLTSVGNARNYIYGEYGAGNSGRCQFSHSNPAFFGWGANYKDNYTSLHDDLAWHTNVTSRGAFKVDGVQVYSQNFGGTAQNLFLFGLNANGTPQSLSTNRIASVVVSDTNSGTINLILVPCQMGDSRIGFWDFKNGVFLPSTGSAPLLSGPETTLDRPEYITISGGAYIDMGIVPSNHETEIKFRDEKSAAGGYLFGGANNNQWLYSFYSSGTSWMWGYSGVSTRSNGEYTANEDHTLIFNKVSDGGVYVDGQWIGKAMDATPTSGLYLGRRYNQYTYQGRVYSVKVTDRSNGQVAVRAYPLSVCGRTGLFNPATGRLLTSYSGTIAAGHLYSGCLEITSDPGCEVAGISPACGTVANLAAGATVAVSAPAQTIVAPEMTVATAGWRLYEWDDATGAWVFNASRADASGSGSSFTYTHTGVPTKLVWLQSFANPLATVNAKYVAPFGDDAADGSSWANAKKTVQAGVDSVPDYGVVLVAPGHYFATNLNATAKTAVYGDQDGYFALSVSRPVSVVSVSGPEKTVIDAAKDYTRANAKVFNADALVSGFSFVNGSYFQKNSPTGVEATAGVISNCSIAIRSQWAKQGCLLKLMNTAKAYDIRITPWRASGNNNSTFVYLTGSSLLDGLVMTNMHYAGTDLGNYIQQDGNTVLRNALVADNEQGSYEVNTLRPMILLNSAGARLEDSTITGNRIFSQDGAVHVANNKAVVTNTIVYANESENVVNKNIHGGSNKACFFSCCSGELATDPVTGNVSANPQFVAADSGDYHLRAVSKAKDMGVVALRPHGAEALECAFDPDVSTSASGESLSVTFSGFSVGETGGITATWDFGDGSEPATGWPTATHTYTVPGVYTVTVTVNDGTSTATYALQNGISVVPAVCYVKEGSTGVFPYDSWEKAAGNLKDAYDVGSRTVIVTNGTYEIAAPAFGISRAVTIRSVEGPSETSFVSLGTTTCNHRNFTISTSDDILLSGFTIRDGFASSYDWTASIEMSAGIVSNCVFRDIRRVSRSAACYFYGTAKVVDCIFDGHGMTWSNDSNTQSGVRIEGNAVLDRCEIFAFRIDNNTVSAGYDGESPVRIAAANAVLRNSYIHHCTNGVSSNAKHRGPIGLLNGRIENCTIVDNVCGGYGGGVWASGGTVVNTIFAGNTAQLAGADVYSAVAAPTISASCASSFADWQGTVDASCTTKSPNFDPERPYHLTPLSTACIDTGTTLAWMDAAAVDKDKSPRVVHDGPDMGCFEYQESLSVPLGGVVDITSADLGRVPFEATFEASIVGDETGLTLVWDFADGSATVAGGKTVSHLFTEAGNYTVCVRAENSKGENAVISASKALAVVPQVCYVSSNGGNVPPFQTWATAATDIQAAIALNPRTVLVTNGTYMIGGDGLEIKTDLELRSVNGPEVTIIDANGLRRNIWMTSSAEGAAVDGFTLMNGTGNWDEKSCFARVEAGTLSHCVMSNSFIIANYRDSAVLVKGKGRMADCLVDVSKIGGNADSLHFWGTVVQSGGIIERCTIQSYNYTNQGGSGSTHGAVHVEGTGIFRNCLVKDCVSTQSANAGAYRGAVIVGDQGTVENCTIVNSRSCQAGAGLTILSGGTPSVINNIIVGSVSTDNSPNPNVRDIGSPSAPRVAYSCSPDLTAGEGNITADPQFIIKHGIPFQLKKTSPCFNAGIKLDWMEGATDLQGNPRLYGASPDMGCNECRIDTLIFQMK